MAWTSGELEAALSRFEDELEAADLKAITIRSYVTYARRFLRWRDGLYRPRGAVGSASALEELSEFNWLVNQYASQIHRGDRVYLWETGEAAGVVAVARVESEPATLDEMSGERTFWRQADEFDGPRRRVRLRIERVVKP